MARRAGKRGRTKMKMSKAIKKRAYYRKRKPEKKQHRKRKRDNNNEIEEAIIQRRDYKGKKIKQDVSDVDTDAGTSLATTQDLPDFSNETSAGLSSCPSDSTPKKKDNRQKEKGKNKRKRKKKKDTSEISGDNKTTSENTPKRRSNKKQRPRSKRRRSNQKGEDETQITKGNESGKPSESAGSRNMNKNMPSPNNIQKGEPTDANEPCNDKIIEKETAVGEEQHIEESSSSSG